MKNTVKIAKGEDCRVYFSVNGIDPYYKNNFNDKNMGKMVDALRAIGISLIQTGDYISLSINPDSYNRNKSRNAGKPKTFAVKKDSTTAEMYRYSDIVFMSQTMTDKQILHAIGMAEATYYRHKKKMKESKYYKTLDNNKSYEKSYLESIDGNYIF